MKKISISLALRTFVKYELEKYGKLKENKLDFIPFSLGSISSLQTLKDAIVKAKGGEFATNKDETSVFAAFKDEGNDDKTIKDRIKKSFKEALDYACGPISDEDIVEISPRNVKYYIVKIEFSK